MCSLPSTARPHRTYSHDSQMKNMVLLAAAGRGNNFGSRAAWAPPQRSVPLSGTPALSSQLCFTDLHRPPTPKDDWINMGGMAPLRNATKCKPTVRVAAAWCRIACCAACHSLPCL